MSGDLLLLLLLLLVALLLPVSKDAHRAAASEAGSGEPT